eukprot:366070-Chlamydomonas_euryale.AAC.8
MLGGIPSCSSRICACSGMTHHSRSLAGRCCASGCTCMRDAAAVSAATGSAGALSAEKADHRMDIEDFGADDNPVICAVMYAISLVLRTTSLASLCMMDITLIRVIMSPSRVAFRLAVRYADLLTTVCSCGCCCNASKSLAI